MKESFKTHERSIKKQHHFGWKLNHEESFRTGLTQKEFIAITLVTLQELDWVVVYYDDKVVEAKTQAKGWNWTYKITMTYEHGKVVVHSVSSNDTLWDKGMNSKWVRLFMYAFQEVAKETDKETLANLTKEIESSNNWEEYEVPTRLPAPKKRPKSHLWMVLLGSVGMALGLGFIIAFLSVQWTYYIFLYELITGVLLGGALGFLIKKSHYTNLSVLKGVLIVATLAIFLFNQYFNYSLLIGQKGMPYVDLMTYFQIRLEAGLQIDTLNLGTIGLLSSWLFQIGLTYYIAYLFLTYSIDTYKAERIPIEVVTFVLYHSYKNKNRESIGLELAKMGWTNIEDQEEVFAVIEAHIAQQQLQRAV
ncbi:MAG: hypothetical protein ACRBFS_09710 [Aureispira sp.]